MRVFDYADTSSRCGLVRSYSILQTLVFGYDWGHTKGMKTTISIPDDDFEAAEQVAVELGLSRSELYANAVREFTARKRREDVTERLDQIYGDGSVSSALEPALAKMQGLSLPREEW